MSTKLTKSGAKRRDGVMRTRMNPRRVPKLALVVLTALGVILADAASKYWVLSQALAPGVLFEVTPFLSIVLTFNFGAAFGVLQGHFFVYVLTSVLLLLVIYLIQTSDRRFDIVALGLVLGGGIANFIDRVNGGGVVDFIDFHVGNWHWPAFNVADIGITVGALGFAYAVFRGRR